jgi:hypothetical protein
MDAERLRDTREAVCAGKAGSEVLSTEPKKVSKRSAMASTVLAGWPLATPDCNSSNEQVFEGQAITTTRTSLLVKSP